MMELVLHKTTLPLNKTMWHLDQKGCRNIGHFLLSVSEMWSKYLISFQWNVSKYVLFSKILILSFYFFIISNGVSAKKVPIPKVWNCQCLCTFLSQVILQWSWTCSGLILTWQLAILYCLLLWSSSTTMKWQPSKVKFSSVRPWRLIFPTSIFL